MRIRAFSVALALALVSAFPSSADELQVRIQKPLPHGVFSVGAGTPITIEFSSQNTPRAGLFLGRVIQPSGALDSYMILDVKTQNVLYVPASQIKIDDHSLENLLTPTEQKGGTCTGYAINNFMIQSAAVGFRGNGQLQKTLSTEAGRTGLLVDSINQYYLVLQHRFSIEGILDQFGKQFRFQCRDRKFTTSQAAIAYLQSQLASGLPVLIAFNLGPQMAQSPFEFRVMNGKSYFRMDRRLWIPRKIGERNTGGHSIVAASSFYNNGKLQIVTIDSDWNQPRIWDVESYLGDRAAISEVEFITCR